MNGKRALLAILCGALLLTAAGCSMLTEDTQTADTAPAAEATRIPAEKAETPDVNDVPIVDSTTVYADDDPSSVKVFYLTVSKGNPDDRADNTFAAVNNVVKLQTMTTFDDVRANVLVQEGDETGPLPGKLGYDATVPNGVIRLRGRTSTLFAQKSYRIDLFDNGELWNGQRALALNKHGFETMRFRNKLYFDLLKDIPDITSLRTQFIHVYVKDLTATPAETKFTDYGLYTQVEVPNKRFLRNHSFLRDDQLYKANMFEFYRYEDKLKLATDPTFDQVQFDTVLEPKGSNDHTKLLAMLDDVNNYTLDIETVFEKYFNRDNFMTFYAYNILMGNMDCSSQNFLLYSPVNSDTWYFMPWDGDDSLSRYERENGISSVLPSWMYGLSDYWGNELFNRVMRVAEYRNLLTEKIDYLHDLLKDGRMEKLMAIYREATYDYVWSMPDVRNMDITKKQYDAIYDYLTTEIDLNYWDYYDSLEKPMPFYMGNIEVVDGLLTMHWDFAYDFDGELVTYDVQIATDSSFSAKNTVYRGTMLLNSSVQTNMLPEGQYYWKVVATNESGFSQIAFDSTSSLDGTVFGARRFVVNADGTISNE